MEIGLVFSLLAAVGFGGSAILTRRGTFHSGESFTAVAVTVSAGLLFVSLLTLLIGDWVKLWSLSWRGFVLLGTGGITHFVFGRLLSYACWRRIGANRGGAIQRTQMFYAVILGIILFQEPLTIYLVLGVLSIAAGAALVSVEKGNEVAKKNTKGILAGLAGAVFWGTSGVLVKPAVEEMGSPYAAVFISYLAAFLVVAGVLFGKGQRERLMQLQRRSLIPFLLAGVLVAAAQLLRYAALGYSPVSIVSPLIGTTVLFVFLFSFLLNRQIEVFTWKVFTGILATVVGTFFLFQ